jgi:hypothetical protein
MADVVQRRVKSVRLVENRSRDLPFSQSRMDMKNVFIFVQISVWCCSFSLAVSVGAALLLPISTISNEVTAHVYSRPFHTLEFDKR